MRLRHEETALRQRRHHDDSPSSREVSGKMARAVKQLDMFPKFQKEVEETQRVHTSTGGCLSMVGLTFMAWLVISNSYYFIFPPSADHLVVDTMFDKKLNIAFDITFPRIPCASLGIDVMDITGEQQVHVHQEIKKQRLDFSGHILGEAVTSGGQDENPWQYMRMDQHLEGCRLTGNLHVQKVSGNFHIALGAAHHVHGKHIHQFMLADIPKFNCSHTIHHLSFGDYFYGQSEPLNGIQHVISKLGGGVFTYYIKVIPTEYISPMGGKLSSNQFTSSYKYRHIPPPEPGHRPQAALPGVFFVYEMNPYMLQVSRERPSFIHFIVNLSAIAGGVFAVSKLLDSVAFNFSPVHKAKSALRKSFTTIADSGYVPGLGKKLSDV